MTTAIKYCKRIFVALLFGFVIYYIYGNVDKLRAIEFEINWYLFSLSLFIYFAYKFGQALVWYYMTKQIGCAIPFGPTLESWFISQVGRYIPGKVFYLGGRIYYYHKHGVSKTIATYCFALENILSLLSAAMVFLISIPFVSVSILTQFNLLPLLSIPALVLLVHPLVFQKIINVILSLKFKEKIYLNIRFKTMLKFFLLLTLNWFSLGIGFVVLINSITGQGITGPHFFYFTGSFSFSIVIGMLSIFAPSGVGVREGIIVLTLREVLGSSIAVVVSVISRIWATLGDFIIILIIFIGRKFKKAKGENLIEADHSNPLS